MRYVGQLVVFAQKVDTNRSFQFQKRGQLFIGTHNETLSIVARRLRRCQLRTTVFSWTHINFPFHTSSTKTLKLDQSPVITVIGKAYFDVGHAPKDQSNGRKYQPGYAAWEIHPVMKLTVQSL
jgi:hypothetical protein